MLLRAAAPSAAPPGLGPAGTLTQEETTMGLLDGKVAIVTGAGRGIGREEALLLAEEGAKVIVNDVGGALTSTADGEHPADDVVALIRQRGGEAAVNGDDIATWEGGKNVVQQAIDTFGQLDILVNNAGILRDKMSFNMEESDWDDVIRVHLKGHFAPTHHAAVYWRNRAKAGEEVTGRIINTSSEAGLYGNAGQANYGAAKAGIAALTWILARELGRYGITANAIAPRARTRMTENLFGDMAKKDDDSFDAWDPRNVANLVAFLASPEAADINGQIFVVFGGSIYAMSAFKPVGQLTRESAWSPSELAEAKSELFKGIDSGVPKFSFF
jgi:NAD(P)-dependent dehydrogenase (short-subunit alcohol dehydrogenase family)